MSEPVPLELSYRERDTIIAALRCWQNVLDGRTPDKADLLTIAADGGTALSADEIDTLIEEKINV